MEIIIKVSKFIIEKIDKIEEEFKTKKEQPIQEFLNENFKLL